MAGKKSPKLTGFGVIEGPVMWLAAVKSTAKYPYDATIDFRATEDDVKRRNATREKYHESLATNPNVDPDTIDEAVDTDFPVLTVGEYLTDGLGAVRLQCSLGNGRGSTKIDIAASTVGDLATFLDSWAEEDLSNLSPAECAARTIAYEYADLPEDAPEGTIPDREAVTFKVSLRPNARTCRVPLDEFSDFIAWLQAISVKVAGAPAHYRAEVLRIEEEDRKRAQKKAADAAKAHANK